MSKLRKEIEKLSLAKSKRKDYDPEDEPEQDSNDDATDSDQEDSFGGREHYEKVGKSKLRQPENQILDSKYGGVAVSKNALEHQDSDEDPFALRPADYDDEDPFAEARSVSDATSSDEENDSEDSPQNMKNSSRINGLEVPELEGEEEPETEGAESASEEGSDLEDSNGSDSERDYNDEDGDDDDDDDDTDNLSEARAPVSSRRQQAAASLRDQSQNLLAGLSQSASSDVNKGKAVKSQYQTFDRLLDTRMKLQKCVLASSTVGPDPEFTSQAEEAIRNAQHAAIQLFNTISTFRENILSASSVKAPTRKRKRVDAINDVNDLRSLWTALEELEDDSMNTRRTTIDKWSNKAKTADPTYTAASAKPKFLDSSAQNRQLTAVLDTFVTNEQDKHFQSLEVDQPNGDIASLATHTEYDDSQFYQSLLRDLITSRAATSSAANDLPISSLPPRLHPSGNKQNKKVIDTKASKGRKVRYTVHEKLQNFMAAEGDTGRDTAMWTERGKREFFGSLFGQHNALAEESDEEMEEAANPDGAEAEALRLFRT